MIAMAAQDAGRDVEDDAARFRYIDHTLSVAHQDLYAKLLFEKPYLLADAGLGSMQREGGLRQVEPALRHLVQIA